MLGSSSPTLSASMEASSAYTQAISGTRPAPGTVEFSNYVGSMRAAPTNSTAQEKAINSNIALGPNIYDQTKKDSALERLLTIVNLQAMGVFQTPGANLEPFPPMGTGTNPDADSDSETVSNVLYAQQDQSQDQSQSQSDIYDQQNHHSLDLCWSQHSPLHMPLISPPKASPPYTDQKPQSAFGIARVASDTALSSRIPFCTEKKFFKDSSLHPRIQYDRKLSSTFPLTSSGLSQTSLHNPGNCMQNRTNTFPAGLFNHNFGFNGNLRNMLLSGSDISLLNCNNNNNNNSSDNGISSMEFADNMNEISNWKSQPRNSISRMQKMEFYRWLIKNIHFPFPSEEDRLGQLAVDEISERKFKYWFANIRCRQFNKNRKANGEIFFVPNAKFYMSCLRLKLPIPQDIPNIFIDEIKRMNTRSFA
ncbi:hypothetical protein BX661DRAFT_179325 [Kickxella alabastrina]|uniref:uncharacterized protein n=1 Tax=Kickxella alabastrina TaxID=61397 RepID=UPI00221E74B2|nr:uncharacterized protein BX661DRAFT_179325 [Kickxella alabastrina]KAI7833189.1 hypothetical protein BX661DRAFT_179325 [Kickxella alabastrina]